MSDSKKTRVLDRVIFSSCLHAQVTGGGGFPLIELLVVIAISGPGRHVIAGTPETKTRRRASVV